MKFGVPVVATRIAVEGMNMVDGQDCMVADTPREFAEKLVQVYTSCKLWERLVHSAYLKSSMWFSVDAARRQLMKAMKVLDMSPTQFRNICT
jgi:glycosyltransferase involved in cell wall biosynthesis